MHDVTGEFNDKSSSSERQLFFSGLSMRALFCRLYRAYQKLYTSMHEKGVGPHKTQFRRDENYGMKKFQWSDIRHG